MNIAPQSDHPPVEILIVEDSPTQAKRLQYILEQQGYHVVHAPNGRQALAAAQDKKPTLIISDVVMPEMDGYELCRQIKTDARLADVPVILVTTLSDPQDVIRGLECRADNFILKPYDERYLVGRVQFVLLNRDVHKAEQIGMGVEIYFNGHKHFITADRLQILNLLLSTYEAAIQRNKELSRAHDELNRLNAQLAVANRELEAFSYSVSHDLRAPLRHISGYVGLLRKVGRLEAEDQKHLATIADCAGQMGRLIDDLLEFSRMGRAEMQRVPVNMDAMLEEAIRGLEPETKGRKIIWKIDSLPAVRADRAMMRQVLVNLLGNAVKYTRTREVAEISVGLRDAATETVLFVRDNGVGFDMRYADKLFGVFQRLHRAEEFEGTGIGLANVRRIIARHGGRTWAESKVDEGSTFYFSLPKSEASATSS
jgi:signal transduction histidine kinase